MQLIACSDASVQIVVLWVQKHTKTIKTQAHFKLFSRNLPKFQTDQSAVILLVSRATSRAGRAGQRAAGRVVGGEPLAGRRAGYMKTCQLGDGRSHTAGKEEDDHALVEVLDVHGGGVRLRGNCIFISTKIQKEIVNVCAIETRNKIIEEISDEAYAILADEPSDISHKKQLALCSLFDQS
jgi:hypothetical protein